MAENLRPTEVADADSPRTLHRPTRRSRRLELAVHFRGHLATAAIRGDRERLLRVRLAGRARFALMRDPNEFAVRALERAWARRRDGDYWWVEEFVETGRVARAAEIPEVVGCACGCEALGGTPPVEVPPTAPSPDRRYYTVVVWSILRAALVLARLLGAVGR
jgi:hypothetical protein